MIAEVLKKEKTYTVEAYFKQEECSNYKNEFRNGKIIAMAGGSYAHNLIIGNIFAYLFFNLNDIFSVLNSEVAIYMTEHHHFVYSDTAVLKGKPEFYKENKRAIINPTLVFEVTSPSTEKYDRFVKFNKYKTIPTFKEYVIVDQQMPLVEVFYKEKNDVWIRKSYIGLEDKVVLNSVDYTLKMSDIYKKVDGLLDPQTTLNI